LLFLKRPENSIEIKLFNQLITYQDSGFSHHKSIPLEPSASDDVLYKIGIHP
jgi:hypothetical protein